MLVKKLSAVVILIAVLTLFVGVVFYSQWRQVHALHLQIADVHGESLHLLGGIYSALADVDVDSVAESQGAVFDPALASKIETLAALELRYLPAHSVQPPAALSALLDSIAAFSIAPDHTSLSAARSASLELINFHRAGIARANEKLPALYRQALVQTGFAALVGAIFLGVTVYGMLRQAHFSLEKNQTALSQMGQVSEDLEKLAFYDSLTELPNRRMFYSHLEHLVASPNPLGITFTVLLIDLDDFKQVNDSFGHQAGDTLLEVVARRLLGAVRKEDMVARIGGDEFAVTLSGVTAKDSVIAIADKLLAAVSAPAVLLGQDRFSPRISVGASAPFSAGMSLEQLLKTADLALYRAKALGKNRCCCYAPEMSLLAFRKIQLESQVRTALEADNFVIHYQPQFNIAERRVEGFEALVRWIDPAMGVILPGEFIEVVEQSDLIDQISDWVLSSGLMELEKLHRGGYPQATISFNIAGRVLLDSQLVPRLERLFADNAIDVGRIKFEVTEKTLIERIDDSKWILEQLRALGIRISIDDFGTGYSSLSYLKMFSVDEVKIDTSFIADITTNGETRELVKAIIALAGALNIEVVAEGVESAEQLGILDEMGCRLAQGYYLGRPAPLAAFTGAGVKHHL